MLPEDHATDRAAEFAARESYGRLLAFLVSRCHDLVVAEDALADAFVAALESWPSGGIPDNPESWLLRVARNKAADAHRRSSVRSRPDVLAILRSDESVEIETSKLVSDDRLRLMLVCAHPAIDEGVRPALMLQTVLGLDAKGMASAFLLSSGTLTKRLVRAKQKIRLSGLRFEEPDAQSFPDRLHSVLDAIYAAYSLGNEGSIAEGDARDELRREAFYLARVVADALPHEPEALGFLALFHFIEARRNAQVNDAGDFVPLLEQDPRRWDRSLVERGHRLLYRAAKSNTPGPFQLEAAIAGAHCDRIRSDSVPWHDIASLYRTLVTHYPTAGAIVGYGVATAHAEGTAESGLAILRTLDPSMTESFQPWWVASAHLQEMAGRADDARQCLTRALGLTSHPRVQAFLRKKLARSKR